MLTWDWWLVSQSDQGSAWRCQGGGSLSRGDKETRLNPLLANKCQQASPAIWLQYQSQYAMRQIPSEGYRVGLQRGERNVRHRKTRSQSLLALAALPEITFQSTVDVFFPVNLLPTLFSRRAAASTIGQGRDQALSRNSSKLRDCSWRASGVTFFQIGTILQHVCWGHTLIQ